MAALDARRVVGLVIAMLGLMVPGVNAQTVTVRIHDYAQVPPESLASAQRLVINEYQPTGVRLVWLSTTQGVVGGDPAKQARGPTEDLTVIVLSHRMAERRPLPQETLGVAVVGELGGGRIAYIMYDRIAAAAIEANWPITDLLAMVIAHELGHLLLPAGSHSADGLMRGRWDVNELRWIDRTALGFSEHESELMRAALGGLPSLAVQ